MPATMTRRGAHSARRDANRAAPTSPRRRIAVIITLCVVAIAVAGTLVGTLAFKSTPPAKVVPYVRPSGLVQAKDSKSDCIVLTLPWQQALASTEALTGLTYNCIETYSDVDPTWSDWVAPYLTNPSYGYTGWLAADPKHRTIILTFNLIPTSAEHEPWRTQCAAGSYDHYTTTLAENLVKAGMGEAIIRLGKEMNDPPEPDYVGATTSDQEAWGQCFAKEVGAMRAVPGAHFLFDWDVNACEQDLPLANFYPGNAYVDIVGIDFYDVTCTTGTYAPFPELAAEPLGLTAVAAFAAAHDKVMSIPEWGTLTNDPAHAEDAPYFVGIAQFVEHNPVAFQAYFDAHDDGIVPLGTNYPYDLSAYRTEFG